MGEAVGRREHPLVGDERAAADVRAAPLVEDRDDPGKAEGEGLAGVRGGGCGVSARARRKRMVNGANCENGSRGREIVCGVSACAAELRRHGVAHEHAFALAQLIASPRPCGTMAGASTRRRDLLRRENRAKRREFATSELRVHPSTNIVQLLRRT